MKTFFQFSEQAKKHAKRKMLNEADAPAATTGAPATGTATTATTGTTATTPTAPPAQAQPDYKTFAANWDKFIKDAANAPVIAALTKTMPQLGQVAATVAKMQQPAQATTTAVQK